MGSLVGDLVRYHKVINDPVGLYDSLNIAEVSNILKNLNTDNISTVIYVPENMKSYSDNKK